MVLSILIATLVSASPASKADRVEIVRPEAYAVKRFGEIVRVSQERQRPTPQEQLISYRASLIIAERKLTELKHPQKIEGKPEMKPEILEIRLKGARAELDHYQHLVSRLEQKILKETRNSRKKPERKIKKSSHK
jgi:hypothetical protein